MLMSMITMPYSNMHSRYSWTLPIILVLTLHCHSLSQQVRAFSPISTIAASYATSEHDGAHDSPSSATTGVACAIVADGTQRVLCWGQASGPAMLPGDLGPFFGIVAGQSFFCGLVSSSSESEGGNETHHKKAVCWSAHNLTNDLQLPEAHRDRSFSTLAAGPSHVCGIASGDADGTVICWSPGLEKSTNHPLGLTRYRKVAIGNNFTCGIRRLDAIRKLSTLDCSGNAPPDIERGIAEFRSAQPEGALLSAISAGEAYLCVLLSNASATNQPVCWGTLNLAVSAQHLSSLGYHSLISGSNFSCAIRVKDSKLECWSLSASDPLSSGNNGSTYSAAAGNTFVCAISSTNLGAYCNGQGAPKEKPAQQFNPAVCQDNITSAEGQWYSPDPAALGLLFGQRFCKEEGDQSLLPYTDTCSERPCFAISHVDTESGGGPPCGGSECAPPPGSSSSGPKPTWFKRNRTILIILIVVFSICTIVQLRLKFFQRFRAVQHFHDQEHVEVTEFTYRQLEMATGGFNEINLVGRGSYGLVYKGLVKCPTKRLVAIKKLEHKITSSQRNLYVDFDSELKLLARLQHPNLVNLVGYCHERVPRRRFQPTPRGIMCAVKCAIESYKYSKQSPSTLGETSEKKKPQEVKDRDRRLLVFDYMANGCLYDHIHEERESLSGSSRVHPLSPLVSSWHMRLRIAGHVAKGLQYLHGLVPPVIHRDVKTSNILLDSEWNARLSDLGISRLGPQGQHTHVVTDPRGTPGYCDPEYFRTYHLTLKSDVYGFGVVLLELLTGQKAIDRQRYDEAANLVSRCRSVIQDGQVSSILDGRIADGDGPRQTESIAKLANIAELCVRESPKERPTMRQVAAWIETLLDALSGRRHALDFDIESEDLSSSQVSDVADVGPHFSHSFTVDVSGEKIAVAKIPGTFHYIPNHGSIGSSRGKHQPALPALPEESGGTSESLGSAASGSGSGSGSVSGSGSQPALKAPRQVITITKQSFPETDDPPTRHHHSNHVQD